MNAHREYELSGKIKTKREREKRVTLTSSNHEIENRITSVLLGVAIIASYMYCTLCMNVGVICSIVCVYTMIIKSMFTILLYIVQAHHTCRKHVGH